VVDLVKHGVTGPHNALDGPFGYFKLLDTGDLTRYTAQLGAVWRISEISTKPYPCGRASHAVLATLADVRSSGEAIIGMTAHVPPLVARLVGRPMMAEMTPAYARLCLPFLAALMLRTGRIDPRRFDAATFADTDIRESAKLLKIEVDANPDPNAFSPQKLEVHYADGRRVMIDIPDTLGSPNAPLAPHQIATKRDLCEVLAVHVKHRLFDDPLAYFTEPR
jgi:2-methylcitrate dehydratase PrpD